MNTGQEVRTHSTHGGQISSLSLRSQYNEPQVSPTPLDVDMNGDDVGVDGIAGTEEPNHVDHEEAEAAAGAAPEHNTPNGVHTSPAGDDVAMEEKGSDHDSLFDDDAEGEEVAPSMPVTTAVTPSAQLNGDLAKAKAVSLALPGSTRHAEAGPSAAPLFAPRTAPLPRERPSMSTPVLSSSMWSSYSHDVLLSSSMDGQVTLIDRRERGLVGRLAASEKAPPWCMSVSSPSHPQYCLAETQACWSGDGTQVLAGRRNGTVDVWDVRKSSSSTTPNLLRTLRTPTESGPVSCVVAFPDGRHIATYVANVKLSFVSLTDAQRLAG